MDYFITNPNRIDHHESKTYFFSPPHLGTEELHFVHQAFESNYIAPLGPMVNAFEQEFSEYTGIRYCVALSIGAAAMHLALRHLGIGPGDEVFASTLTFIGSVTPIVFEGAVPVFIDAGRTSWNMDPELLAAALEERSRKGKLPRERTRPQARGSASCLCSFFTISHKYGLASPSLHPIQYPIITYLPPGERRGEGKNAKVVGLDRPQNLTKVIALHILIAQFFPMKG